MVEVFYWIGFTINIVFLFTFIAWMFSRHPEDIEDVLSPFIMVPIISLFSWILIFVIFMVFIFDNLKDDK